MAEKAVTSDTDPRETHTTQRADLPAPESAQLLYPDEEIARKVADEMGLDGVHEHTLDGDTYWMPGDSHAAFEDAMDATEQEGFADYESFADCVRHNDEKDDPEAYCASIKREVEGKATPEGVPEDYEYVSPDEEPPEDHDVVESDRGGTYVSPEPTDAGGRETEEGSSGGAGETREIPDDELRTGNPKRDFERVGAEGSEADVDALLDQYGARNTATVDGDEYYRIETMGRDDPEVAVKYDNGDAEALQFSEFLRDVGDGYLDDISYEEILGHDVHEQNREMIYREGGTNYHATSPEAAVDIIGGGRLEARDETRGLSNQSAGRAVFTSDIAPMSEYGDVVFEVDVGEMADDEFTPDAGKEPPVEEAQAREQVASEFSIPDFRDQVEQGVSRDTEVFYDDIPLDYLRLDADEETVADIRGEIERRREDGELSDDEYRQAMEFLEDSVVESEAHAVRASPVRGGQNPVGQKAEFQIGEQVMWEYQDGTVHGVVREVVDGPVSLDNGAERAAPQDGEMNYVVDEWDDTAGEYQRANVVKSGSELDESTADIPDSPINAEGVRLVPGDHNPVGQKAEFEEGAAVRWSWQGNPVHGRVAEVRPDQATVSGNTITGDEGESVYVIDEWDDRVEAYRRQNVAKPESSLDESGKDLPPRSEGNYVNSEAWESVTTVVSESDFTAPELDQIAREYPDVLYQGARPTEWALVAEDPVVYRADIPDKYLADQDESLFVPNAGVAENARKVDDWTDEHGDDVAGGAPDGEGLRRGNQLVEYHDRGEPLAVEYWEEILNYHERSRAQGNHELDSEYQQTPWEDAGYVSNLNWGGDAGYEQAQRVMDHVESVDQELTVEMEGAVATEQSINRDALTEADSNRVDLDALEGELREAVEADEFYIYGKASIEQWDSDDPPTHIQMDALEGALGRFFQSETAPGIISRHHQDIPVGVPVESFEFQSDTTLEIGDERYQFEAGDIATSHVEDADGDGRPELWLAANISNDNEMSKKTRVLAAQGDLDGFSVTVHRNEDEMTQEGRVVTDCDLHAVTIGHKSDIKNKGSQFDVASVSGKLRRVADMVRGIVTGD